MEALICILVVLMCLAVSIVILAGYWKMLTKAGQPGWAILIPIYNAIVILQIAGRPVWWIILLCIPLVNIIIWVLVGLDLAKNFGKDTGFAVGIILLGFIFIPILGFGDAKYLPGAAAPAATPVAPADPPPPPVQ